MAAFLEGGGIYFWVFPIFLGFHVWWGVDLAWVRFFCVALVGSGGLFFSSCFFTGGDFILGLWEPSTFGFELEVFGGGFCSDGFLCLEFSFGLGLGWGGPFLFWGVFVLTGLGFLVCLSLGGYFFLGVSSLVFGRSVSFFLVLFYFSF